jgi:hypothetical protein
MSFLRCLAGGLCSLPKLWAGGAPGPVPQERETGRGCLPPQRSCARSDQAGASEPKKRFHDPYIIRMQTT